MAKLEELTHGARVRGVIANHDITVVSVEWHSPDSVTLFYREDDGKTGETLLYRDNEVDLETVEASRIWSFDGDGADFKLASEALRIRLAYLFDPLIAVNSSDIEPLPHQITAVYEKMLPRQPLRFLLADDPGAGKTIMAGLLMKELLLRGDLERCMVVCPGNLVEQWQDELDQKFSLPFEILTNDKLESSRTGNWFIENNLVICRLDKLSRDELMHDRLKQTDWDLIVVDEAHKMSATYFGGEAKYTKRYRLGQLLGTLARHLVLMTATPHNGKEEDFELFMALLDADRFEGKPHDGPHTADMSDLMRRLVKEQLVRFDGTALFPERFAYTVKYRLSDLEAHLYQQVTDYVREEFNRADKLEEGRKGNVGFALTVLQRRLASSPAAIAASLRRRRERLEGRLREEELLRRGKSVKSPPEQFAWSMEDIQDLDDAPDAEAEELEEEILDQATTAQTIEELKKEIAILVGLEKLSAEVLRAGTDKKWEQLSQLLQTNDKILEPGGTRRKLVIFTEHRDTLQYLRHKITTLLGAEDAVVTIYGGMGREQRKLAEERFKQDKAVQILVATDAAGEGINLQRAHLMVNYDLPWNPNRLEQRFGRIHRIGQREICHLWNLVAEETREGDVFFKLLDKLQLESRALNGRVFDVLGQVFQGSELRDLLIRAIRGANSDEARHQIFDALDELLDHERLRSLIEKNALSEDTLDASRVQAVRDMLERARVRKLQPHFIRSFFIEAFERLGGRVRQRETERYELKRVPAAIRNRDRLIGRRAAVLPSYERITFERLLSSVEGKPDAEVVTPGHPLLVAVIDLILERHQSLLKQGTVLVDEAGTDAEPRVLVYLKHTIVDGRRLASGQQRVASERIVFVEIDKGGAIRDAGYAPFHEYRSATADELERISDLLEEPWLSERLDRTAVSYAVEKLVPAHLNEVRLRRESFVDKATTEVRKRLIQEITYWGHRAASLKEDERAGKVNARINSQKAQTRADDLERRLQLRLEELEQERRLSAQSPVILGGALIVPARTIADESSYEKPIAAVNTAGIEALAMKAVMDAERSLGCDPRDVSALKVGWDIESRDPATGELRFIEVKGRQAGQDSIFVTKNEMIHALNEPERFILAIVLADGDTVDGPWYIRSPKFAEPTFTEIGAVHSLGKLLSVAVRALPV